jgi:hypothetical protein
VPDGPVLSCPSAQPGMKRPRLLGVVGITADGPRVIYLNEVVDAGPSVLAMTESIAPTRVFRLAAACETTRCAHFSGERCELAARIVSGLKPVVDVLPVCTIRSSCRWYQQEGRAACLRCPQVVTELDEASAEYRGVANPAA